MLRKLTKIAGEHAFAWLNFHAVATFGGENPHIALRRPDKARRFWRILSISYTTHLFCVRAGEQFLRGIYAARVSMRERRQLILASHAERNRFFEHERIYDGHRRKVVRQLAVLSCRLCDKPQQ